MVILSRGAPAMAEPSAKKPTAFQLPSEVQRRPFWMVIPVGTPEPVKK